LLTKTDKEKILQDLVSTDWDTEHELIELNSRIKKNDLPRLRIEHSEEGKHRFFIDYGESYIRDSKQYDYLRVKTLKAIVFAEQQIRAFWLDEESHPRCYAIDDEILGTNPVSASCEQCPESIPGFVSCKPKVRLFVLPLLKNEGQPMVMSLSPTSIKPWREHQLKLQRSGLPPVAVITTFELEDCANDQFRWARIQVGIRGVVSKANLIVAKQAQQSINRIKTRVITQDFCENGDRVEKSD
jgi:hypothetical protein